MALDSSRRAAAALLLLFGAAGCRDDLPTAIGPDQFPDGALLTSVVLELPAADYLQVIGQFNGYVSPAGAPYLIAANRFEDALDARALIRLAEFPASVTYTADGTTVTDSVYVVATGRLIAPLDTAASTAGEPFTLRLQEVAQAWDPGSATWSHAVATETQQVPWNEPGGSLGDILARTTWAPGDTVLRDTVAFQIDSLGVTRIAAEGFRGLAVLAEGDPVRIQLRDFILRAGVRPESRPDTIVEVSVPMAAGTFILEAEPPLGNDGWNTGGVAAARTLFRITLPDSVPGCAPGTLAGVPCPRRAIRDVTLNEVALSLRPLPVDGGFRPLVPQVLRLREIGQPELGRRAPLGRPVSESLAGPALFAAPADTTVTLPLTAFMVDRVAADTAVARVSTPLALLAEPEGETFGHARFTTTPSLRIVYTLPVQRTSP